MKFCGFRRKKNFQLLILLSLTSLWTYLFVLRTRRSDIYSSVDLLVREWHLKDPEVIPEVLADSRWKSFPDEELVRWKRKYYARGGNQPGDDGSPVILKDKSLLREATATRSKYQLNSVVSALIPLNRTLPDYRSSRCKEIAYPAKLPPASIIIVFHNEALSTLLRTAISSVDHCPEGLINEIIFVDDASDDVTLKEPLNTFASTFKIPSSVVRSESREGLINARLLGAKRAASPVLIFLDAHMEASPGWCEPLLSEILYDRTKITVPVIDDIDSDNFSYKPTEISRMRGGFDWKLRHAWIEPPKENLNSSDPFPTPTIIGGVFAVDKQYFFESGSFDPGMKIWGGENIEISLRTWRCGGSLITVPCSRIGHVYRKATPHSIPGGLLGRLDTEARNIGRCARVWLDEFEKFYLYLNPRRLELGDLKDRLALKEGCHGMKWYLENVYPDSPLPFRHQYVGQIVESSSRQCLDAVSDKNMEVGVRMCHGLGGLQTFILTETGSIRSGVNCLELSPLSYNVTKGPCVPGDDSQTWKYEESTRRIIHALTEKCLTLNPLSRSSDIRQPKSVLSYLSALTKDSLSAGKLPSPFLSECADTAPNQNWLLNSPVQWE